MKRITLFSSVLVFMVAVIGWIGFPEMISSVARRGTSEMMRLVTGKEVKVVFKVLAGTEVSEFRGRSLGYASEKGTFIFEKPGTFYLQFKHPNGNTLIRFLSMYKRSSEIQIDYIKDQTQDRNKLDYKEYPHNARSRLSCEPITVLVQGGRVRLGAEGMQSSGECLEVFVTAYAISQFEISNGEFLEFVRDTGYLSEAERDGGGWSSDGRGSWGWVPNVSWRKPFMRWEGDPGFWEWPVVMVSWRDANEYCRWLSKKTGKLYRLPKEAEWEKAARGVDGRIFPWGDDWERDFGEYCNHGRREKKTSRSMGDDSDGYLLLAPVGAFPRGASPYGVYNMVGNAKEWVQDVFKKSAEEKMGNRTFTGTQRVLKGGGWYGDTNDFFLNAIARNGHNEQLRFCGVGFRIVEELEGMR